jgi:formate dehydrogenase subunit gamma
MTTPRQIVDTANPATGLIVRYAPGTRIAHWLLVICFMLLALSGLAMFYPSLFWLSALFGGGDIMRAVHPWIGLGLIVAFLFVAARVRRYMRMEDRDRQWLRQTDDVVANREEKLPEVGRYNAGQKLVYFSTCTCVTVLLLTGLEIWRAYFTAYFPVDITRLASLLHAFFAFVLILTIVVHIYAAIWVKGSVRAMTRGTVTYGWAWKHHRLWFRDVTKAPQK